MGLEDLLSGIFGGGESPSASKGIMPGDLPTSPRDSSGGDSGGFDFGKMLGPLLIGGGSMLASKLLGSGMDKDITKATKNIRRGGDTASAAGQAMVDRASKGQLTDPQQARVDRMKAEQNAQWSQRFAQMGIPVSTMQSQATNLVTTQAEELANKLINESFDEGIRALGLGTQSSQLLLSNAMKQKEDLAKTIGEVAKQMGMIFNTPGKTGAPNATTVPAEWGGSSVYDVSSPEGMGY